MQELERTEMLFGKENVEKLKNKKVIVFGIGGVGGNVCEALARTGVGFIDLVDNDTVSLSNINRQVIALHSTVGRKKTEVMKERILDINPSINVNIFDIFYTRENQDIFDFTKYDYVIDAIDTVSGKIALVEKCTMVGTPIISSMGTGNKVNPLAFKVADINKTSMCPLARVMRNELRKRGIKKLKVVYSEEEPKTPFAEPINGRIPPSSCAFIPPVAGLIIASEVIKELMQ